MRGIIRKLFPGLGLILVTMAFSGGTASATIIRETPSVIPREGALMGPTLQNADSALSGQGARIWVVGSGRSDLFSAAQAGANPAGVGSIALFDCLSFLTFLETGNMVPLYGPSRDGVAAATTSVPEPGTLILLAAGFPGIVLLRRKMRR